MTNTLVAAIEPEAITSIEPLHGAREIGGRRLSQQMIMIVHEHVSMQAHLEAPHPFAEQSQEMLAVALITEDRALLVASSRQMVPQAGMVHTKQSRHVQRLRPPALSSRELS